jgi:hypothetical protein
MKFQFLLQRYGPQEAEALQLSMARLYNLSKVVEMDWKGGRDNPKRMIDPTNKRRSSLLAIKTHERASSSLGLF